MAYFVTSKQATRSHRIVFTLMVLAVPSVIRDFNVKIRSHVFRKHITALKHHFEAGWDFRGLMSYCDLLTSNFYPIIAREVSDTIIHITHNEQTRTWRGRKGLTKVETGR